MCLKRNALYLIFFLALLFSGLSAFADTAVQSNYTNNGFNFSSPFSLTIPNVDCQGSDRVLVVRIVKGNFGAPFGTVTITGVDLGGAALTHNTPGDIGTGLLVGLESWYLINPTSGAATVTINATGTGPITLKAAATCLTGADQTSPITCTRTSYVPVINNSSIYIPSRSESLVLDILGYDNTMAVATASGTQTSDMNIAAHLNTGAASHDVGASAYKFMEWTMTSAPAVVYQSAFNVDSVGNPSTCPNETFCAAGAGEAGVDGDFVQTGIQAGRAYYTQGSFFLFWNAGAVRWEIGTSLGSSPSSTPLYYNAATDPNAPTSAWSVGTGAANAPGITAGACGGATATPTPTATETGTATPTLTFTPTETPTAGGPTDTPTPTATPTETFTPTITPTQTSTNTPTITPTRTATPTVTPIITPTPTPDDDFLSGMGITQLLDHDILHG